MHPCISAVIIVLSALGSPSAQDWPATGDSIYAPARFSDLEFQPTVPAQLARKGEPKVKWSDRPFKLVETTRDDEQGTATGMPARIGESMRTSPIRAAASRAATPSSDPGHLVMARGTVSTAAQGGTGDRSWARRHAVGLGALVGAGVGATMGYSLGKNCEAGGAWGCTSRGGATALGAALGAGGGILIGLLFR